MIPRFGLGSDLGFTISPPGRPRLGFELVFDNLSIERAAADVEHPRGLFLVPVRGFEDAHDVRALGLGERGQMIAGHADRGRRCVQELDTGRADRSAWRGMRRARNRTLALAGVSRPLV